MSIGPKSGLKLDFLPLVKFGSLVFLKFTYSDSLQQCLNSTRGKIYDQVCLEPKLWQKGPKSGLKLVFFCHFHKSGSLILFDIAYNNSLQQWLTSSRGKTHEKNILGPNLSQNGSKSSPKLVFYHLLKFGSLVFL